MEGFLKENFKDCKGFLRDSWEGTEDDVKGVALYFDERARNVEVEKIINSIIALFLKINKNVNVTVCDEKNPKGEYVIICLSEKKGDYIPIHKKTFLKFHHVIDFEDGIKIYEKDTKHPSENYDYIWVAEQLAFMTTQVFLKFGIKQNYYEYGIEGNYFIGWGLMEDIDINFISRLAKQLDFNKDGLFFKRDWLEDKDKIPTTGSGKV